MEVEKQSSKGGFLQLFDWNLKSKKKLFSNKSELPENLRQGKENVDGFAISRLQQVHEYGRGPATWGDSDFHYHSASSLTGDERYGTRAPGVVARLMGLDSLPTSNFCEPYNAPSFDSQSFRDSYYLRGISDPQDEHHIVIYESMRNKFDGLAKNPLELSLQKVQGRPIQRFQTEVLPWKSAKPMPVTHSRLMSPIRSPGFTPPKNAAYVMEAAARIIQRSPQSTAKGNSLSFGSSSVPLRVRDSKEKIETAQKSSKIPEVPNKQNPSKHIKRQPRDMGDMHRFRDSEASTVDLYGMKSEEKSVSLAVQAKPNVQKRDGLTSTGSRSVNQKQHIDIKQNSISKNQPSTRKSTERRTSSSRSSDVLRQNNQKQNCMPNKDNGSLRPSASHQKDRKVPSTSDMTGTNKSVLNTSDGSGETNPMAIDSRKGLSESKMKKFAGKRHPVSVDNLSDRSAINNAPISKAERIVKCNISIKGHPNWDAIDRKSGTDVVSFIFTSPIKKSLPGSNSVQEEKNKKMCPIICPGDNDTSSIHSTASSSGNNAVGGDALSVLLEQKLKELTSKVDSSHQDLAELHPLSNSANSFQDSVASLNSMNTASVNKKGILLLDLPKDKPENGYNSSSSLDQLKLGPTVNCINHGGSRIGLNPGGRTGNRLRLKRADEMGEQSSSSNIEYESDFGLRYPNPASSLEPFLSETSCNSLDCSRSDSSEVSDSKWCTSIEADEMSDWNYTRTLHVVDGNMDLADSASSRSDGAVMGNMTTILTSTNSNGLRNWELDYVRAIISNADLMFEGFACGQVHQIIEPNVFQLLECQVVELNKNLEEPFKIARKALFDCVEECLELRCKRIFCGSFRAWAKWTAVSQKTDLLAEDLCREILAWTNTVDLMVDELVDNDMSSQQGKWVEFETERFEEGLEIEVEILSSLVDELVEDL